MLFHCENIGAKIAVVLFRIGIGNGISGGKSGLCVASACSRGG